MRLFRLFDQAALRRCSNLRPLLRRDNLQQVTRAKGGFLRDGGRNDSDTILYASAIATPDEVLSLQYVHGSFFW